MTLGFVMKWAVYLILLSVYIGSVRSYYRPSRNAGTNRFKRLAYPGDEEQLCNLINTSHLNKDRVPSYVHMLHEMAKKGFVLAIDEELLRIQPNLLRLMDHRIRILMCDSPLLTLFNIRNQLTQHVNARVRWVDVYVPDDVPWPHHPSIDTYQYQQETNLFTVLYVSHLSSSLLEARKAGLQTMAVTIRP